jgi:hypothetical protein
VGISHSLPSSSPKFMPQRTLNLTRAIQLIPRQLPMALMEVPDQEEPQLHACVQAPRPTETHLQTQCLRSMGETLMTLKNMTNHQETVRRKELKQLLVTGRAHLHVIFTRRIRRNMAHGSTKNTFHALHLVFPHCTVLSLSREIPCISDGLLMNSQRSFQSCTSAETVR